MWSGSTAETRLIETTPVPDSYRTIFAAGPCNTLHRPSLIDWHLAFGSAASVTAALAFLEADSTRGVPTGDPFLTGVGAAWHRAQPSIRTLARLDVPGGDVRWRRAVAADRTIRALQPFARGYEASVFLAEQYLRAAEFHRSPELLATARLYLRAATEGVRLFFDDALVAMAADPPAAHLLNLPAGTVNAVRDMEARASVLHATLTRAPTDLAEATRLLDRGDGALLRSAAFEAYEHGGDLCDVDDRADLEAIRTACENRENDFEGRLLAYWRVRATLELLDPQPAPLGDEAFDLAAKLLRHRLLERRDGWSIRLGRYEDVLADLYIRRAERVVRTQDRQQRSNAFIWLVEAERLTSPATNPARFRQIADRYLTLWQTLAAAPNSADRPDTNPSWAREAAFLARTRAGLPQIATGTMQ
ncbi:hypothetical protein [Sphingomonas sp.]|uniref:hypothetical protein n=1 Tax=Sphingomonas sp. TaxID=28214 RepID=UPI003B00CA9F